jgi:predicted amidohydrolase
MSHFKIAGVQMDCRLMDRDANLEAIRSQLQVAAKEGARLIMFPECITDGYCFKSKEEALPYADAIPGRTTETLFAMCKEFDVNLVAGTLEVDGGDLYNAAVLVSSAGLVGSYRKVHLPYLGVDRFTTSGTRPWAVHEIEGVRIGMIICYDSSFPESARCLTLAGADVIALPTNWPIGAMMTTRIVPAARAIENHIYFAAINRIGFERGFKFLGRSSIANPHGELVASTESDEAAILYADVDVKLARDKRLIRVPGEHEIDRLLDRRPAMYGPIVAPITKPE